MVIEPKFKKGDLVIGNDDADCYAITKKGWIGEVVEFYDWGQMKVKKIGNEDWKSLSVDIEPFDLYNPQFEVGDTVEVITEKHCFGSVGIRKGDIGVITNIAEEDNEVQVRFKCLNFDWSARNYELKKVEEVVLKHIYHLEPKSSLKHDDEIILEGSYPLDEVKLFETTLTHCELLPKKELRVLVNKYTENPYKYSIGEIIDDLTELL